MALAFGKKLGPYEIQSPLGAGGMGEVYRARDTRLDRTVAIKILPVHLSDDPEAKQRFEREARAISSLNHSNICHLYDVGRQDGIDFIVMEFLEGETLADRLRKGPLQLAQVLKYGIEVCDGLDQAHRSGVVHRDLKPGNIMLTKAGAKLMDFGLAKGADALKPPSLVLTASLSSPVAGQPLTAQGTVVGTFQYISPEQLEGREADARSDIFALGAVLYEMATGKRAFDENSTAKLIAAILKTDPPPISTTQPMSPPALDRVVKSCLSKDPDSRWQNVHDLGTELRWIAESTSRPSAIESNPSLTRRRSLRWSALAVSVLALAGLAGGLLTRKPEKAPALRLAINIPAGSQLALSKQVVLSPDGRLVAMVLADVEGKTRLWVRRLDREKAQPVAGTEGAMEPFWSPDSQSLGFFTLENKLKKVTLSGETVQALCDAGSGTDLSIYGGAWNRDGVIVFSSGSKGLYRVPASGGTSSRIPVEGDYRWPSFLPDEHHLLVLSHGSSTGIFAVALEGGPVHSVLPQETSPARYADPGYILFAREGNLLAQPFSLRSLHVTGSPFTVTESVEPGPLSFSVVGELLLHVEASKAQLTWVDREGNRLSTVGEPNYLSLPNISPDGNYAIATVMNQQKQKLWLFDFQRGTAYPFTLGAGNEAYAAWSPDGKQVAFSSTRENGQEDLFLKPVNSGGGEQPLVTQKGDKEPDKWSPDGRFLLFDYRLRHNDAFDIWVLPTFGDRKPYPFIQGQGTNAYATFSPDGKWVAYQSTESGQTEIYVVPFPGPGGKWQVSKGGGGQPFWPRGKELFYVSNDFQMIGVEFEVQGKNFLVGKSRRLFERQSVGGSLSMNPDAGASIDVNRDGTRWLVAAPVDERNASPLILTTNWISESRK
jgi:eukaryotic-like serine/threonine-protein kinase